MQYLKPEDDLLLHCLKIHFNPGGNSEEALKSILKKKPDWEHFISVTSLNRVFPMVWNTLNNEAYRNIPEEVSLDLQKICHEKEARSIYNLKRLNELLILFRENNIGMIPFKGPNLNKLYKNYALRQSSDLDIIIHKND